MSKKVVLSGYYGYGNFGDEAILYTLVNKLKDLDADVTVLSGNPRYTSVNYYVKAVKNFAFSKISHVIKDSDVLISGGGSLLQDVTSLKSLLYYAWVIWLGIRYKKDVIIFAQGIGPINNSMAAFVVKYLLKKCAYVSVRDENSLELLNSWNIQANLVCDPIYSFPIAEPCNQNLVGVQLRDFKNLSDNLLNGLARQIVKEFSNKKIRVLSFQDAIDLNVCNKFAFMVKSINPDIDVEVLSGLSGKETIDWLSKLEYLIAMRFHALLLAMKFGVRSIAVNYDIKVEKLAVDFGLPVLSLSGSDDFAGAFENMMRESANTLIEKANEKRFNWDEIERILQK